MKKVKTIIIIVVALIAAAAIVFLLWKAGFIFNKQEDGNLKIDDTSIIVTDIKKISELTSACYYKELIIQEKKANKVVNNKLGDKIANLFGKKEPLIQDEIVLVVHGSVRAGVNLQKMTEQDIRINKDTLFVTLPEPEILDIIVNPSDYEIFVEDGTWSHEQITAIITNAKNIIREDAVKDGLIDKTRTSGEKTFFDLFKTFGYKEVIIKSK